MPDVDAPLPRRFFDRPAVEVAPALLGRVLVVDGPTGPVSVRLTEVEAYSGQGEDPGSHAHRGRSNRNAVMFGPPGHVYVYFTYGMHWCMNLVCLPEGVASAVLLRAGEVVDGLDEARARRPTARSDRELARGPARLTMALGVDGAFYGLDACAAEGQVRVLTGRPAPPAAVRSGPRVGVAGDGAPIPWRYWIDGDPTVSVYRAAVPRRRREGSTS